VILHIFHLDLAVLTMGSLNKPAVQYSVISVSQVILTELFLITDYFEKITIEWTIQERASDPEFKVTILSTSLPSATTLQPHPSITRYLSGGPERYRNLGVMYRHLMYPIMDRANGSYTTGWVAY
jgi:hypothetical protein